MRTITNHPVIVLIVVLVVTGAIAIFTIYSPKLSIPALPGSQSGTSQNGLPISTAPSAVAISKRNDYSLQLMDSKSLVSLFGSLKVWGKTYTGTDTKPLNTLIVYLVDKPGQIEVKDPNGNVAFSYTAVFQKDILELSVYLPDSTLKNPAVADDFFGAAVVLAGSKIGGTNATISQIPNNQKISGLFQIIPLVIPTKKP